MIAFDIQHDIQNARCHFIDVNVCHMWLNCKIRRQGYYIFTSKVLKFCKRTILHSHSPYIIIFCIWWSYIILIKFQATKNLAPKLKFIFYALLFYGTKILHNKNLTTKLSLDCYLLHLIMLRTALTQEFNEKVKGTKYWICFYCLFLPYCIVPW